MLVKLAETQISMLQKSLGSYDKNKGIMLPDNFIETLISNVLERNYMSNISESKIPIKEKIYSSKINWLAVRRLPVPPGQIEQYNLLPRWQSTISTLHTLGHKFIYVLLRYNGITHIYFGAVSTDGKFNCNEIRDQLMQAVICQMPGVELERLENKATVDEIYNPLINLKAAGAVTGIPNPRKDINYGVFQTLDQIAFGVRDCNNVERDFMVMLIADPITDNNMIDIIANLRNIGSEVHTLVQKGEQEGSSVGVGSSLSVNVGVGLGGLTKLLRGGEQNQSGAGGAGGYAGIGASTNANVGRSESISYQYLDKTAQYCEQLIDKHIERLNHGRSLGFWNTGIYVLGDNNTTTSTVMGMLRSIYSGDESYIEPIRTHLFPYDSYAVEFIKKFQLIPFPRNEDKGWHPLGNIYEWISTPINTEELSIASSMPRRDVPGLRFVRNSVRFVANPPNFNGDSNTINIGNIMDMGVDVGQNYSFSLKSLAKHGLITGITGSGKSTTCRTLVNKVMNNDIPFLIIEPAKDEYVRWAMELNKSLPKEKQVNIYIPGIKKFNNQPLKSLKLNPFQPAVIKNGMANLMARLDRFKAAIIACLPMTDVLPIIFEETLYAHVIREMGEGYFNEEYRDNGRIIYPLIENLSQTASKIIDCRGYEQSVCDNLKAAITTRVNSLTRGWKKEIFNVTRSNDYSELFEHNSIINLSYLADDKDKLLVMSLLFISLYEYRASKFSEDEAYREKVNKYGLCQLTLIEEAHRILANAESDVNGIGNPQAVVSKMFSEMISEIRAYGQGLIIVDQVPSRLIPDAVKNTNLKVTHRLVAADDRKAIAACMSLREDQEDIISVLQPGEAIVCSDYDDAAAWIKVNESY